MPTPQLPLDFMNFLDAPLPRSWPQEEEFAGGILAYFEVMWSKKAAEHLAPTAGTGFDWAAWSTRPSPLKKKLTTTMS